MAERRGPVMLDALAIGAAVHERIEHAPQAFA
jgi:hypothetical protein